MPLNYDYIQLIENSTTFIGFLVKSCCYDLNNFDLPSKFELNDEYTGEWIFVLNRAANGRLEMTNADESIQVLSKNFPDHSNSHLRVWPKQSNFDQILYEINPYGCRDLSFNFRRWAEVFNLQHALCIPSYGKNGDQDDDCDREDSTTLDVKEIIDEVKNLLRNEMEYRNGYIKRALNIMTDLSIVNSPPKRYENILS